MPQGLQTFDENGKIILDITHRLFRFRGRVSCNTQSGSAVLNVDDGNRVWLVARNEGSIQGQNNHLVVNRNGKSVSWYYETINGTTQQYGYGYVLYYGDY